MTRYGLNKFGARSTTYNGKRYHSQLEAGVAAELDLLVRAGELKEWKSQHKFRLNVYGKHITTYICDFKAEKPDGTIMYIEVKGFPTELGMVKLKLIEAILPETEPDAEFWIYWSSGKRERKV